MRATSFASLFLAACLAALPTFAFAGEASPEAAPEATKAKPAKVDAKIEKKPVEKKPAAVFEPKAKADAAKSDKPKRAAADGKAPKPEAKAEKPAATVDAKTEPKAAAPAAETNGAIAKKTTPPKAKRADKARRAAVAKGPAVTLLRSGFHLTPRGSELVIQTSGDVVLETHESKLAPTFVLKRCRALRANDRRPLDTTFFATSVTGVSLRQRGADLEIHVTLRDAATVTTRKEQGPGDASSLILEFTEPPTSTKPAPAPQPPDAPTATAAT